MDLSKILQLMFETPGGTGTGTATPELSIENMIDELAADDKKIDDKGKEVPEDDILADDEPKEKKEAKKKDEEEIEIDDIDDEDKNEKVEIDDLDAGQDFRRKEFLKKYPTAFKEFPELEKAYYREQAYSELLPTLDDAKIAVERSEQYGKFEEALLGGDTESILNSVKTADAKAFNKIVDDYLPTLAKVDQSAYFHVIGNVIKNTIVAMARKGKEIENDDLRGAAVILNQFIFGENEFKTPVEFGPKPDKKDDSVVDERAQLHQERFESALEELTESSNNIIKSTISKHIDPKDSMTDYVRNTAIERACADVDKAIAGDARFKATIDKLWQKAGEQKFSRALLADIKKAYLNKAKTLLRPIIQKHRSEALKGLGKRDNSDREEPEKKGPVKMGRSGRADNTSNDKTEIPKNKSTLDVLMEDD